MQLTLRKATKADYSNIKKLYRGAFPPEERAPFFMLKRKAKQGKADFLVADSEGTWAGFTYVVCDEKVAYIFLLAIAPELRGQGCGSKVLEQLKEHYRGKRLFLAREQLDPASENYEQRLRRHEFYLKNGFEDLPCQIKEATVTYDCMGVGGNIKPEEYDSLMAYWSGTRMARMIGFRMIEK